MRPIAIALVAVIAVSAGVVAYLLAPSAGISFRPISPGEYTPPSLEQIQANHNELKMERAEKADAGEVPLRFTDKDGNPVDLASYRGKKNVVLVVVKGLPQRNNPVPGRAFCPGCLAQINALVANYGEFQKRNAEIVLVFPGPKDSLPLFLSDARVDGKDSNPPVQFPLVADTDLSAVNKLGITGDLARPATYILDTAGNVVFAYVSAPNTSFDRPSVKALLERLDKLKKDGM
jgi:peroxiredoxin